MFNKLINTNTGEKNMTKKFEHHSEGQMAREIMMNALAEALETKNNQVNITEQLRDLKDMFDSGVLTEEEYEMAKQKVLKP